MFIYTHKNTHVCLYIRIWKCAFVYCLLEAKCSDTPIDSEVLDSKTYFQSRCHPFTILLGTSPPAGKCLQFAV